MSQDIKIEVGQRWQEKYGSNIVEVRYVTSSEITFRDVNGSDYGVEARMYERDFRKKYKPTDETLRKAEKDD